MTEKFVGFWRIFAAGTFVAALAMSAVMGIFGVVTPVLSLNSIGMVVSVGDLVETVVAGLVGFALATFFNHRADASNQEL